MFDGVDTRVPADLHPATVRHLDSYDEETSSVLAATESAFDTAYQQLIRVNDACEAARADPTMTPAAALVKSQEFADQSFKTLAARFDGASANLKTVIAGIEQEFSAPIESKAGTMMSSELRAYVAKLPQKQRLDFVMGAIKDDDARLITAVLGAPSYLSGLKPEMMPVLRQMYFEHHQPVQAKRLKAAKAGLDHLGARAPLLFKALAKAVGADRATVERHRTAAARTASAAKALEA